MLASLLGTFATLLATFATLLVTLASLQQIGGVQGDPPDGSGGTVSLDGTPVAVQTAIVSDLQEKRSVPKGPTAFNAFTAGYAEAFVDDVLVVRIFYKSTFNGSCRT